MSENWILHLDDIGAEQRELVGREGAQAREAIQILIPSKALMRSVPTQARQTIILLQLIDAEGGASANIRIGACHG